MIAHTVTASEFSQAKESADATFAIFNKNPGHYTNSPNSHIRGKVGEIACANWLTSSGAKVDPAFLDPSRMRECDIVASIVAALRLDVKTWDEKYWDQMGRCVAVAQLDKLRQKADGIVWMTSSSELAPGMSVSIVGWSTLEDVACAAVRTTGPRGRRQVENYQLDEKSLRSPSTLLHALRDGLRVGSI